MLRSTPLGRSVRRSVECQKEPETEKGNSDSESQSHRGEETDEGHHRESVSATPVDSRRRLLVPGRGAAQPSERALSCARLCVDVLAESAVFGGRVCPSHLHRPATSRRSAPSRACVWDSAWSAPANSSHDVSHHRTASGNCSLGATLYYRTHTSSGASYRERNRLRKVPERTNGTPGVLPFAFPAALRSLRSLPKHAHPNATHPAHVPLTTYSPLALDQLDRSQSAPTK